ASDTGVLAFFALELGTLPTGDLEVEPLLDTACTVSTVSEADADLVVTTVLQCAAQDLGEHEVIFTTPVPSGAHPAWQDGDEVRLAVQRTDDPDTIEIHNTSVGIRTVDGSLLFAGVGDTIVLDGLGNEFTGTPNDNPVTAVLAPLSLETTLDVCGEPSEEFASAPIEVSYTLGESELALLGNAEGQLEVDGRTFAVLQESAHLSASGHAGFGLQLAVIALE
ncbi:MAG: hypothetical protein JKY37_28235, partial [Nannocystaceae bacterium]|nr:hypothetical protein [Nannocystaceae bacterium]